MAHLSLMNMDTLLPNHPVLTHSCHTPVILFFTDDPQQVVICVEPLIMSELPLVVRLLGSLLWR